MSTFAGSLLPVVFVVAAVWMAGPIRIPTGEDHEKAYQFRGGLVEQLEQQGLPNLKIKAKPWPGGRGDIILETPVSPEKMNRIRREFDRLNVAGSYELKVRAP